MDTQTLSSLLTRMVSPKKCSALGVFPRDLVSIGAFTTFPACCIANTDPSTEPGEHWVAFYAAAPNDYEFFDSYGLRPDKYCFDLSLQAPSYLNHLALQSDYSSTCAHFCLYYLNAKTLGVSMPDIIRSFSPINLTWNDKLVKKFVNKFNNPRYFVHSANIPSPYSQISIVKKFVKHYH